jgi:hypothetical protein
VSAGNCQSWRRDLLAACGQRPLVGEIAGSGLLGNCCATVRQVALTFLTRHPSLFAIPKESTAAQRKRMPGPLRVALTRIAATEVRTEFAPASLLEGGGFEPPVPRQRATPLSDR